MTGWLVITPECGEVIPITDEGQGPMEYGCDTIEIEAETRRDAIIMGVKLMRAKTRDYHWFQHADGNPFVGITAELLMCHACEGTGDGNIHGVSGTGVAEPYNP